MINRQNNLIFSRIRKISLLPLLSVLFFTLFFEAGAYAAYDGFGLKGRAGNAKHSNRDTIPESEIANLKSEDIDNILFRKDIITIKFKNGDSVLSKKEDYIERPASNAFSKDKVAPLKGEEESSFPGGPAGWMRYLNKTFRYPEEAVRERISGTVVVQFIIDKEGNVSGIEAISGPNEGGLREEAVRVIKRSGRWLPAKFYGHPHKSYKKQSITYGLY